jgi:hypothetical protein
MIKHFDDATTLSILSEWAKGRTYPEIAADFGLAENAVINVIRRGSGPIAGKAKSDHIINMTARQSTLRKDKRKDVERDERVIARWKCGMSAGKIGMELGVTRNVVIGIVHRNKVERSRTRLAKSERQRDKTAQALERRASGTLLRRRPPQLELVSSVELPPRCPEPPMDLYAHLRSEDGLRKALEAMILPRDIISEQRK